MLLYHCRFPFNVSNKFPVDLGPRKNNFVGKQAQLQQWSPLRCPVRSAVREQGWDAEAAIDPSTRGGVGGLAHIREHGGQRSSWGVHYTDKSFKPSTTVIQACVASCTCTCTSDITRGILHVYMHECHHTWHPARVHTRVPSYVASCPGASMSAITPGILHVCMHECHHTWHPARVHA